MDTNYPGLRNVRFILLLLLLSILVKDMGHTKG